eukprot:3352280-Rhodomonas_salina.2
MGTSGPRSKEFSTTNSINHSLCRSMVFTHHPERTITCSSRRPGSGRSRRSWRRSRYRGTPGSSKPEISAVLLREDAIENLQGHKHLVKRRAHEPTPRLVILSWSAENYDEVFPTQPELLHNQLSMELMSGCVTAGGKSD